MKPSAEAEKMKSPRFLSVSQAAALCHVGRTTVGYWVRSRKLYAKRSGRSFAIPVEDLLHFLKSTGQPIPAELRNGNGRAPVFKSFQNCWHYFQDKGGGHRCEGCAVFRRQADDCFSIRGSGAAGCPEGCRSCRYYLEMFVARFGFIHQIELPAAVYKGLNLWGGNREWAALCGIAEDGLIGLGIERIVHHSSLAVVISALKRIELGKSDGAVAETVYFTTPQQESRPVHLWTAPLREPEGSFLMLAAPKNQEAVADAPAVRPEKCETSSA
jgi:excisionase family DNA binding protein